MLRTYISGIEKRTVNVSKRHEIYLEFIRKEKYEKMSQFSLLNSILFRIPFYARMGSSFGRDASPSD